MCVFAKHKKQERGGAGRGSWLIEVLVSLVSSFFFSQGKGMGGGRGKGEITGFPVPVFGFLPRCHDARARACVCVCVCFLAELQLGFN